MALSRKWPGAARCRAQGVIYEDQISITAAYEIQGGCVTGTWLGLKDAAEEDAPRGRLFVDPALPDWLPDVTVKDLRLGRQRFNIHFWRDGKDTVFKVLKGKADAVEKMSMKAWRVGK